MSASGVLPLATAGVVVCSILIPAMGVYRVAVNAESPSQVIPAVIATALVLPVQVWLVVAASRGRSTSAHRWALAGVAAVIVAALPFVGVTWLGALFPLSALVLVVMPRPYAIAVFAVFVVLPIPIVDALNEPTWTFYFWTGTFMYGLSVAVPIWLIAAVRDLERARLVLADEAVVLERVRIDRELRGTVGEALTSLADQGEHALVRAAHDSPGAATEVRTLVDDSRRSLADIRRLVRGYQATSLRSEVAATMGLLTAAGIETELVAPPDVPRTLHEVERHALRAQLAEVLSGDAPSRCVCTVSIHSGVARVTLTVPGRDAARVGVRAA